MAPTLPRAIGHKFRGFGILLALACACRHADPPVAPGPPLAAEPELQVESMDAECAGLVAALDTYGKCPNLDDDDRAWAKAVIEAADQSFAAGKKGDPDDKAQHVIAVACHRAAVTMHAATERCQAGPRPRQDD